MDKRWRIWVLGDPLELSLNFRGLSHTFKEGAAGAREGIWMCKIPHTGYSETGRMGVACDDLGSECLVSYAFSSTFPQSLPLSTLFISQLNKLANNN